MTRKVVAESARLGDALLQATDQGLLALGEIARESVYNRIEKNHGVRREEISQKVDIFHKALVDLLGAGGSVIERLIAKNLYSTLGLNFRYHEDWTLVTYFNYAKAELYKIPEAGNHEWLRSRVKIASQPESKGSTAS